MDVMTSQGGLLIIYNCFFVNSTPRHLGAITRYVWKRSNCFIRFNGTNVPFTNVENDYLRFQSQLGQIKVVLINLGKTLMLHIGIEFWFGIFPLKIETWLKCIILRFLGQNFSLPLLFTFEVLSKLLFI